MKKLYFLNETEKERILNLYENKGNNKNILNEEEKATPTTGALFVSGFDADTAFCLGNHQPNMAAKGNYGSVIATDGKFLYYKDNTYSTQADYEKWFNGEIEGDLPPISGTYACTKRSLGGETKRTLKRTEAPKAAAQPAAKVSKESFTNYPCIVGKIEDSSSYSPKKYIQQIITDDTYNVFYDSGVYYMKIAGTRYPTNENTFYKYSCDNNKIKATTELVNIDNKPIGGTSVTTKPAANQGYYANKLANVGQKLGVQTSGQLTPDMLNKLMDKLGGTGSTPKEPTSITI